MIKRLFFLGMVLCFSAFGQAPDFSLVGFATMGDGTSGGAGGDEITVTSGQQLYDALDNKGSTPLTIYIDGKISSYPNSKIDVKEMQDISIIGVGSSGEIEGYGIKIWKSSNIIIRNLKIHHVEQGDKDCIGIEGPSNNVWVDHCELYNDFIEDPTDTGEKDRYDGLLDAKGDVKNITYSWNYLHDSWKTMLVGSSDGDDHDRNITIHHNWFEANNSRLPLFRFGHGHIFNNYYNTIHSSGVNSRMGAELFIENNHFENAQNPVGFWYSDETGYWNVSNNTYVNCTESQPTQSTTDWVPGYSYAHVLHPVEDVPSIVQQYAGVGKLDGNGGDDPVTTRYTLTVSVQGQGSVSPQSGTYDEGQSVSLTATAADGWEFDRWEGPASGSNAQTTLTMNSNLSVTAFFTEQDPGGNDDPGNGDDPITGDDPLTYPEGDIYVSPDGDDSNDGSEGSPFKTLDKAIIVASAGDVIYLRGGSYSHSESIVIQKDGGSDALIHVFAYEGETPVISFAAMEELSSNRGVVLDGDYWHFRGIIIEEAGDNGMLLAGSHNVIERCIFRKNHDSGLQLSRYDTNADDISQWPSHNTIKDCESYDNRDSGNENADGFAPKLTCGEGNLFLRCVAHHNIDDGWDMYTKSGTGPIGVVTLIECIAHNNGTLTDGSTSGGGDKNGFKLGGSKINVNHIVRRCVAFQNGNHGFTDNSNLGSIEFTNCTAWENGDYNFHVRDYSSHIFKNCVSFAGNHTDRIVSEPSAPNALTEEEYDWDFTASAADFVSMTPGPDSDPLRNGFLKPVDGSALVDAGVESEGIAFNGSAPDLGAVESGGLVTAVSRPHTATAQTFTAGVITGRSNVSISYSLPEASQVSIQLISSNGRMVRRAGTFRAQGEHTFTIDKKGLSRGMYFVAIDAGSNRSIMKKVMVF